MVTIHPPELVIRDEKARLQAKIEGLETDNVLWFEADKEYKPYMTSKRSDAFVVGLLWPALKKGEDIVVKGAMSEKLYYSLNYYLIPLLSQMYKKYKQIQVHCENLDSTRLKNNKSVGTGLSCGVDSLHTIAMHQSDTIPARYKITHLAYFNVGSNHLAGSGELMQRKFRGRTEIVAACAKELGKPLIIVDSNLSDVMNMDFVLTYTLRNVSAVLVFQKLFHVYYIASGGQVILLEFGGEPSSYEAVSLPLLSTENVTFYSSGSINTRVEKTKTVSEMDVSYRYLNVCIHHINNCGKCIKCRRTLLTLDILGVIDKYENIFNLENFYSVKDDYINEVLAQKDRDEYSKEIYDEMVKTKYLDKWKRSQSN